MKYLILILSCIISFPLLAMQSSSISAGDSSITHFLQDFTKPVITPQAANEVFSEEFIYELIQGSIHCNSEKHQLSLQTRLEITVTELLKKKQIIRLKSLIELCDERRIKFDSIIENEIMSFIEEVHAIIASRELVAGNFKKNQFRHSYDFEQRLTWMVKNLIRVGNSKSILTFIILCNRENIVLNDAMYNLLAPFLSIATRDERARL